MHQARAWIQNHLKKTALSTDRIRVSAIAARVAQVLSVPCSSQIIRFTRGLMSIEGFSSTVTVDHVPYYCRIQEIQE